MERHSAFERRQKLLEAVENGEAQCWAKRHKAAKNRIEKLVKSTDHTHACYNLKNFESEMHAKIGNGSYEETGTTKKTRSPSDLRRRTGLL